MVPPELSTLQRLANIEARLGVVLEKLDDHANLQIALQSTVQNYTMKVAQMESKVGMVSRGLGALGTVFIAIGSAFAIHVLGWTPK